MPRASLQNPARSPVPLFGEEHSEEQWQEYLDERRRGITPDLAARAIGLTGSRMRAFLHREPERARQAEEASAEGATHYQERLKATARVLALDTQNPNPRVLEVELATHVPGYEHLRRDRVKHEGHVTHGIVIDLDPEKLDALPVERLQMLRDVLAELDGDVIDAEAAEIRELPAA
jgi:hypothetical protein